MMRESMKPTMQDDFQYGGLWWLPSKPKETVAGTLRFNQLDGIRLDLLGSFRPILEIVNEGFRTDVINGVTENGIICTLFNNFQRNYSFGTPGFPKQKLVAQLLLLGNHYSSLDDLQFERSLAYFEHLEEWLSSNLFQVEFRGEQVREYAVSMKNVEFFDERIDAIESRVRFATSWSTGTSTASQYELTNEASIGIEPEIRTGFSHYRQWFFDIQRLLSLLFVQHTNLRRIHCYYRAHKEDGTSTLVPVNILYQLPSESEFRHTYRHDMLLTFDDLKDYLKTALERWLSSEFGLQQAKHLFFGLGDDSVLDVANRFVNLVNALEAFHRSTSEGHYMALDEWIPLYQRMVEAIPQEIGPDHRQSLKSRLYFGFQYSQTKRIQELFKSLSEELRHLIKDDYSSFASQVVKTRNFITHSDESETERVLFDEDRADAYFRLRLLWNILFLKYIGIDEETIAAKVRSNRRLWTFISDNESEAST